MNKLQCDICKEQIEYIQDVSDINCEILHFSGWLNGKFNHHLHICKECIEKYEIQMVSIDT